MATQKRLPQAQRCQLKVECEAPRSRSITDFTKKFSLNISSHYVAKKGLKKRLKRHFLSDQNLKKVLSQFRNQEEAQEIQTKSNAAELEWMTEDRDLWKTMYEAQERNYRAIEDASPDDRRNAPRSPPSHMSKLLANPPARLTSMCSGGLPGLGRR